MHHFLQTPVLIIGGGATGTGLARDLALRGIPSILAEKGDINSGASGGNHGLLHSGGRYVSSDPDVAGECREENELLKRLAPHCIEDTGGLFVAVEGDDEKYIADFPHLCNKCGIPVRSLDIQEAREQEPVLSPRTIAVYRVHDATIDPFRISLENMAQARKLGATYLQHTRVVGFNTRGRRIESAILRDGKTREEIRVEPAQVVAACGAWVGEVAALAGVSIPLIFSKGTLLVTERRLARGVINRLRPPGDGDILVPGGTVSILGTTSVRIGVLDEVRPTIAETDLIVREGKSMLPILGSTRYIRAYSGVRPLLDNGFEDNDRFASRGFTLLDHTVDGLDNFLSIPGGKLSTFRYMAEKTADLISKRLGVVRPCRTGTESLPDTLAGMWTEPGLGPKRWLAGGESDDLVLCECEILPRSIIDSVIQSLHDQQDDLTLTTIGLRSRMGKGPCQGTFCGIRVTSHLYERGDLTGDEGLDQMAEFLQGRWKGERPVLWDGQIIQAELKEAIYCAAGCLDMQGTDAGQQGRGKHEAA